MDQVNLPGLEICAQFCVHVHVCTHTHARGKPECRCSLEQKKERLESSWDHGMWTVWEKKRVSHPCHIPKRKTEPCVQYTWRQTQGGTMNSFPSRVYEKVNNWQEKQIGAVLSQARLMHMPSFPTSKQTGSWREMARQPRVPAGMETQVCSLPSPCWGFPSCRSSCQALPWTVISACLLVLERDQPLQRSRLGRCKDGGWWEEPWMPTEQRCAGTDVEAWSWPFLKPE